MNGMSQEETAAVEYVLSVYDPDSDTLANRFVTRTPLVIPNVGERIFPVGWSDQDAPHLALEVVAVEHYIEHTRRGVRQGVALQTKRVDVSKKHPFGWMVEGQG
jgi:hypothetical protein